MKTREPFKITREEWAGVCRHPAFLRRWGLEAPPEHPQAFVYGVKFDFVNESPGYVGPVFILAGAAAMHTLVLVRSEEGGLRDAFEDYTVERPPEPPAPESAEPLDVRTTPLNLNKRDWERLGASADVRGRWGLDERGAHVQLREGAYAAKFKISIPNERPEKEPAEDYFYVLLGTFLSPPLLARPDAAGALFTPTSEKETVAA